MIADPTVGVATSVLPAESPTACTHCGLPLPSGLIDEDAARQFCCHGCRAVFDMLHNYGLQRFYELKDRKGAPPAQTTRTNYSEFDEPDFQSQYGTPGPNGTRRIDLQLEGVHCAACVWLIEKLPSICPGVLEARLHFRRATLAIVWNPNEVLLSHVASKLAKFGYPPHPPCDASKREWRQKADRKALIRVAVAAALAGNVMLLAFALYGNVANSMEPQYFRLFRGLSCILGLLSVAWPGSVFWRGAIIALRTRTANLDVPITLGICVGTLVGIVNTIRNAGEIYFDTITVLIFFLLVGRWIQHRQQRWAADSVALLFHLTPSTARVVRAGGIHETPIRRIRNGDLVEIRAGDVVPVDGVVDSGTSRVDRKLISGESNSVRIQAGSVVHAGTLNLEAPLRVHVRATGAETRVGQLMRLVEECSAGRAPVVQFADRISGWFVIVVIALSLITLLWWWDTSRVAAVEHAMALLIVTCPCALGLATPLAISVAIGRAARAGFLIKGGAVFELLAKHGLILLDKTGTVTEGRLAVLEWHGPSRARLLAGALESGSAHPIARAICDTLEEDERSLCQQMKIEDLREEMGRGICGQIDKQLVRIGSARMMREHETKIPAELRKRELEMTEAGISPVWISINDTAVALIGLGDPIADGSQESVQELAALGWHPEIISGDHPMIVEHVARGLNIRAQRGDVSPEEKLARVKEAAQLQTVVMVGDGVNDSAALAAAHVGVAVHGSAEASLAAADVYLQKVGLRPLVALFKGARRTVRVIRTALITSLAYNAIAAALAMAGWIHPIIAAILMPLSSLTVVGIAIGSRTFGDRKCQ